MDAIGVAPSAEVTQFMTMSFYLFDIISAAAVVILLPFVDVEKHLSEINTELLDRKKQAVLAWLRALPLKDFTVLVCDFANWAETAPLPCFILKK